MCGVEENFRLEGKRFFFFFLRRESKKTQLPRDNAEMMMEMEMESVRERKGSSRGLWLFRQSFSVCEESSGSVCLRVRVRGPLYRFLEWRGVPNMAQKQGAEFAFLAKK